MDNQFAIQLFEQQQVRIVWDAEVEKYYFSIVDVVQILTDSADGRKYWNKLKQRLKAEGNESVTNCHQLKLPAADGKKYKTDVADLEQLFRLIQSIPSKKAEPIKQWLAELGSMRIDQMIDPELTFQMAVEDYRRQGYSDKWIENRLKSIRTRNELTNEWKRPRWIVVCNFRSWYVYDMEQPNGEPQVILLENFHKKYHRLTFLVQTLRRIDHQIRNIKYNIHRSIS